MPDSFGDKYVAFMEKLFDPLLRKATGEPPAPIPPGKDVVEPVPAPGPVKEQSGSTLDKLIRSIEDLGNRNRNMRRMENLKLREGRK